MIYDCIDSGILLRVRLSPNSSSCRLSGIFTDADGQEFLKVAVVSVPEKGKANKELLNFIAKVFSIAKSQCRIVGGELDRYKKVEIKGNQVFLIEVAKKLVEGAKE